MYADTDTLCPSVCVVRPCEAKLKTSITQCEGEDTRTIPTYNPQVARDEMFQLGRHRLTKPVEPDADGNARGIIAPVRSSSALILSSTNIKRQRIYVQQTPISAAGFSSKASAPHFPHTVRLRVTKKCTARPPFAAQDNNTIMYQPLSSERASHRDNRVQN